MLKVLWFANTPANAEQFLDIKRKGTGGWLQALDKELQNHVDLHIAFYHDYPKDFKFLKTNYYPIKKFKSKWHKIIHIVRKEVFDKDHIERFNEIVLSVNPDIIHIHGTEGAFGVITDLTGVPVVVSIQGIITVYHYKYFAGIAKTFYNFRDYRTGIKGLFNKNFKSSYIQMGKQKKIEGEYFKKLKYVIGRTDWDKRVTRVLAPNSVYFHQDEILRESFYSNVWTPPNNSSTVISSTISETYYKGLETIIYTANLLKQLNISFKWQIIGINEGSLIAKIIRRGLHFELQSGVIDFCGHLNEIELIEKLKQTDIYVMPSHIENSPNSLCEAMILGVPCISTFVGGVSSLLIDKKEGLLVQSGDPWSLAGAILELKSDSQIRKTYGDNARQIALKRHDRGEISRVLKTIYESIIYKSTQNDV